MSGRESGREHPAADPDALEVVASATREKLEGSVPDLASPEDLRAALEQAFDYRGDVLIRLKNGSQVEGYVFDRHTGNTLDNSFVRLLPKNGNAKLSIRYSDIAALAFTGRDMAAGKSWQAWVQHYWGKKAAGETDISLQPENLE